MTTAVVAPICPVHRKPMNQGNRNWYCSAKMVPGQPGANAKGYCIQAMEFTAFAPPPPPYAAPVPTPVAAPAPNGGTVSEWANSSGDARLAAAALDFAATLHANPEGLTSDDVAIACAVKAYKAMKAAL